MAPTNSYGQEMVSIFFAIKLHALNNFSSSIDKVSFKKQHVSRPCSFGGEDVHADADAHAAE